MFPPAPNGSAPEPTTVRNVHKIGYQVIRSHLLMVAGVFHYCHYLANECTVTLDGQGWPSDEHGSRPVRHGSYVIIVVPPQNEVDMDTQIVAETIQNDMEQDTFMDFLLDPDPENDDLSLLQQTSVQPEPVAPRFLQALMDPTPSHLVTKDELPQFHNCSSQHAGEGAVLRPLAVLNPRPVHEGNQPKVEKDGTAGITGKSLKKLAAKTQECPKAATTVALNQRNKKPCMRQKDPQQTTLESFFSAAQNKQSRCQDASLQTTILQFFTPTVRCSTDRPDLPVTPPARSDQEDHAVIATGDQLAMQSEQTPPDQP